ncbi:PREDICTED: uncharacterized protein LOC109472544 [Branchiostoma belcheri]|uniref:Uncharacterized protein LOC109472544 n=1 Tax=Branchiostoma belcheri TaxID=7741 RepID=A0A6P4Z9X2_BRABE|nr:PREDICTED: uncharacterized protein LOC109472544 [Branchiostoma belcheri]
MATAMQNEKATDRQGTRLMETCMTSGAGVLYALLQAMLSASAAQFLVLSRQAGVPSLQLIFLIKLAQLLVVLVALPLLRPKLTTEDWRQTLLLSLSAITDNLVSVLKFLSFVFAVPGIAFGIMNGSTPFVTACIGFVFLEEILDMVDCFGIVLSSAGVIVVATGMIMENTSPVLHLAASILLPLATAFSKGPHTVMARSLIGVQGVSVLTVTLYSNLLGAVVLLGLTYLFETPLLGDVSTDDGKLYLLRRLKRFDVSVPDLKAVYTLYVRPALEYAAPWRGTHP